MYISYMKTVLITVIKYTNILHQQIYYKYYYYYYYYY